MKKKLKELCVETWKESIELGTTTEDLKEWWDWIVQEYENLKEVK